MREKIINVSKIDAARRQLETAIRLYFHYGDVLSIHTLTCASFQILMDVGKIHNIAKSTFENLCTILAEHGRKDAISQLKKPANFLKHADSDAKEFLELKEKYTEILMYDACQKYEAITNEQAPLFVLYEKWFILNYHEEMNYDLDKKDEISKYTGRVERKDFFNSCLSLLSKPY